MAWKSPRVQCARLHIGQRGVAGAATKVVRKPCRALKRAPGQWRRVNPHNYIKSIKKAHRRARTWWVEFEPWTMCRGERLQESLSRGRRGKLLANMLRLKFYLLPPQGYLETWQDLLLRISYLFYLSQWSLMITIHSIIHSTLPYLWNVPVSAKRHFYLLMMVMINVYDVMIIERVVAYFLYTEEHWHASCETQCTCSTRPLENINCRKV